MSARSRAARPPRESLLPTSPDPAGHALSHHTASNRSTLSPYFGTSKPVVVVARVCSRQCLGHASLILLLKIAWPVSVIRVRAAGRVRLASQTRSAPDSETSVAAGISHGNDDLARTGEWIPPVCHQHIVEHQNVTLAPGKGNRFLVICLRYMLNHCVLNGRSITVVDVVRNMFFIEHREHGFTHGRRQR